MKRWDTPTGLSPYRGTTLAAIAEQPHWVYEIYSATTRLCLYVGMTNNLKRRTKEHRYTYGRDFIVKATEVPDRLAAERLEQLRIAELAPANNRRLGGSTDRLPARLGETVAVRTRQAETRRREREARRWSA